MAAEVTTTSGETVELGQAPKKAHSWNLRFPTTPIKKVILVKEGVAKEVELEGLEAFTDPSVQTGTATLLLANSKCEAEPEGPEWSPTP
jgi:hypothetical protein